MRCSAFSWMQVFGFSWYRMPLSRRQKLIMAVGGALFGNNAAARQSKVILKYESLLVWSWWPLAIHMYTRTHVWVANVIDHFRPWWNSGQGRWLSTPPLRWSALTKGRIWFDDFRKGKVLRWWLHVYSGMQYWLQEGEIFEMLTSGRGCCRCCRRMTSWCTSSGRIVALALLRSVRMFMQVRWALNEKSKVWLLKD